MADKKHVSLPPRQRMPRPLHSACQLGHMEVVEAVGETISMARLKQGITLRFPGFENSEVTYIELLFGLVDYTDGTVGVLKPWQSVVPSLHFLSQDELTHFKVGDRVMAFGHIITHVWLQACYKIYEIVE